MFGKQFLMQDALTWKNFASDEERDKIGTFQNDPGKILIEVSVSKQNMHDQEITQIIREIFELNNRDLEVKKVVMPIGESTWQIQRESPSEEREPGGPDGRRKRLRQNRMKPVKHNGSYKVKLQQSLNRSRQNSRRKLIRKHSDGMDLKKTDVAEVHSSPAITNLLSQLYPNPYTLLNLLEVHDKSSVTRSIIDVGSSCNIKFEKDNKPCVRESYVEQEANSPSESLANVALDTVAKNCDNELETKTVIVGKGQTTEESLKSTPVIAPEKVICQKLKRKVMTEPVLTTANESEHTKANSRKFVEREANIVENDVRKRSKVMPTESKIPKQQVKKTWNAAEEKVEGEKGQLIGRRIPPPREKISISAIHPMSLQKTTGLFVEKKYREKGNRQVKNDSCESIDRGKKKIMTEKNKCIVKYLKLIKDMYEAEERKLQCQIDDARNYAIDQIEKPGGKGGKLKWRRKNEQNLTKARDGACRNSESRTPGIRCKKTWNEGEKTPDREVGDDELLENVPVQVLPALVSDPEEPSCSKLSERSNSLDSGSKNCQNFAPSNRSQCGIGRIIRTETYAFNRKKNIEKSPGGLPVDVINTVHESNRKIDLLIRQIDNGMDWLSQSERRDCGNVNSASEKAEDLSEYERNLSWRKTENKKLACCANDLLLGRSYSSLHIFPIDNCIASFRIRSDSLFNMRSREYLWSQTVRLTSLGNLLSKNKFLPPNRSLNIVSDSNRYRRREDEHSERNFVTGRNFALCSEVPELSKAPSSIIISVEGSNELGGFDENSNRPERGSEESFKARRKKDGSKVNLAEVKTALETEELRVNETRIELAKSVPSSFSMKAGALRESASNVKPVVVQEITWNFHLPAPVPVTRALCRNERNLLFTTMEASVLHVARTTSFLNLALMNVVQVVDEEPRQQSSIIISLHKCSSFVKNNDGLDESGKMCKFVVLPSDVHFTDQSSGNVTVSEEDIAEIKVLKKAEIGSGKEGGRRRPFRWDSFRSESSTDIFDEDVSGTRRLEALLRRTSQKPLTWIHSLPDPYESSPEAGRADVSKTKNFEASKTDLSRDAAMLFPNVNDPSRGNVKFEGVAPSAFRYLSSETSNTSLDGKNSGKISNPIVPLFPEIKKENASLRDEPPKESKIEDGIHSQNQEDEEDSSSTSSFKSSNDRSDVSELFELIHPKKKTKRSHFLDRLFHELRSFRKCLAKRRGSRRRTPREERKETNEFEDALSELSPDEKEEKEKQKVDEAVAVNATCTDEIEIPASYAVPRKIFKTSFRGKESVTELMIDLKDVSMSEVSDISVEKRKLSTDHTKISIVISKQGDKVRCVGQATEPGETCEENCLPSPEGSYHSLKAEKTNCLGWKNEEGIKSEDEADDEDFKSVDSGKSLENVPEKKAEDEVEVIRDELAEPQETYSPYGEHKFDFYRKLESASSGREIVFSRNYEKKLAPLRKALTDMQVRVRNIQKNSLCTSDEYYERALRMAKMSAGYCQWCKSKTVIPEDPLGIYQKFIPRSCARGPYGKQRKYYFKTTSSTNSSFYSVHSSNSDIADKFCHLNSSSSIITNELSRSRGRIFRESANSPLPLFPGRAVNF